MRKESAGRRAPRRRPKPGRDHDVVRATRPERRGLVLIAAVGVLGVLSLMGLAFATVMRLEAHAARNFTNAVRAEFVARSGIEDAISRLRVMARMGAEEPFDEDGNVADWYTWCGTKGNGSWKMSFPSNRATNFIDDDGNGKVDDEEKEDLSYADWVSGTFVDGGDNYTLTIQDAASKINVNTGDNLGHLLDNLCRAIGPPLRAADQVALVPRYFALKMASHEISQFRTSMYVSRFTKLDTWLEQDLFYRLGADGRPMCNSDDGGIGLGPASYGDGFAIAGYRARKAGGFLTIDEVRDALTYIERSGPPNGVPDEPEEQMEIEAKFAAMRPYITADSWADTDQCGYGKFEHFEFKEDPKRRQVFVDRDKTWNVKRNYDPLQAVWNGELEGCYVAMLNGIGQGQIKRITRNTIDTIYLDDGIYENSEMVVEPTHETSYVIIGKDFEDTEEQVLYIRQPLSFHRAPLNVNTATDKVLTAALMGLQTDWGPAGYPMYLPGHVSSTQNSQRFFQAQGYLAGTAEFSVCPSVVSVGREMTHNSHLVFPFLCPNKVCEGGCFFCNYGRKPLGESGKLNEAHMLAWQIMKEREQTKGEDGADPDGADGYGPFKGWDDLYFRVFRKFEMGRAQHVADVWTPRGMSRYSRITSMRSSVKMEGKRGIARLCMANFNSNTDILKFNPNLEWINRWGPNFTDLYVPYPQLLQEDLETKLPHPVTGELRSIGGDVKLRLRPGELLDKTDLNIGTTEFSFDSGGVYDVESIGRVYGEAGVVAERRFSALIKVYDVWRESTQREFARGVIMRAQGRAGMSRPDVPVTPFVMDGMRRAGQVAVDRYRVGYDSVGNPVEETGPAEHKALATYPEPITPSNYTTARSGGSGGRPAALNVGLGKVPPAGYDGCIMLATNNMAKNDALVDNVLFYNSFTGDLAADVAAGTAEPKPYSKRIGSAISEYAGFGPPYYQPLDYFMDSPPTDGRIGTDSRTGMREMGVGLFGIIDSPKDVFDIENIKVKLEDGTFVREGEGATGDLRVDGIHLGVTGALLLDGSFEFPAKEGGVMKNLNNQRSTVTMWFKPTWHHGTRMRSTLPLGYFHPDTLKKDNAYLYNFVDRGCHVTMRNYDRDWYKSAEGGVTEPVPVGVGQEAAVKQYIHHPWPWPCEFQEGQKYNDGWKEYNRGLGGYVRDRFEHEFFNAANAGIGAGGANDFRMIKAGDYKNSHGDMDMPFGSIPHHILIHRIKNNELNFPPPGGATPPASLFVNLENDWDMFSSTEIMGHLYHDSKPYYYFVPFRWHFLGFTFNPNNEFERSGVANCGGMDYERTTWRGEGLWPGESGTGANWNHGHKGQPLESTIAYGFGAGTDWDSAVKPWNPTADSGEPLIDGNWIEIPSGNRNLPHTGGEKPIIPDHYPDRTAEHNLSDAIQQRPFIDTMRTFGASPHSAAPLQHGHEDRFIPAVEPPRPEGIDPGTAFHKDPDPLEARLRSWAYEQYGTGTERQRWPAHPSNLNNFGVNRGRCGEQHAYQRLYSGTYGTMDELVIFDYTPNPQIPDGFNWPINMRSAGRYYTWKPKPGEEKPWFLSQTLFDSERAQSLAFATKEEEKAVSIELGTIRWTVFTPYYCVDVPTLRKRAPPHQDGPDMRVSQWEFNTHEYFYDITGDDQPGDFKRPYVTQMWRHRPEHWSVLGERARNSSQRGCRLQVVLGASDLGRGGYSYPTGTTASSYYDDPEAWEPIVDTRGGGDYAGRHLKAAPGEIRYKVTFELSHTENQVLKSYWDACLIDSPVFDDVTITYMRRPKVLEWRD